MDAKTENFGKSSSNCLICMKNLAFDINTIVICNKNNTGLNIKTHPLTLHNERLRRYLGAQ